MGRIYTLIASMLLISSMARADELGLRTRKQVGDSLRIALNEGVVANLTWSSGVTDMIEFDGYPQTIVIKSDSLTISSVSAITALYLPNNGLVSLNTTGLGTSLVRLICSENELKSLQLSSNTQLEELDCQGNELTALNVASCRKLRELNCSKNQISSLIYSATPQFVSLLCADNQIDRLSNQTRLSALESLWCQNNKLKTLTLSGSAGLKTLVASSNGLSQITFTSVPKLTDVWVANNELTALDLSTSAKLVRLSVHDNNLHEILWSSASSNTLTHFYAHNNALAFNSFPTIYTPSTGKYSVTATIEPQRPYSVAQTVPLNEQQDFSLFLLRNAWGEAVSVNPQVKNGEGNLLVRNTDYTNSTQRLTFTIPQQGVTISANSSRYPGFNFTTTAFDVYDPTTTTITDSRSSSFVFSTDKNRLIVRTDEPLAVKIYTISGICLVQTSIEIGSTEWTLPSGIYLVNGNKVAIP